MTEEATMAAAERLGVLEAFDRALGAELHHLARWPGTLWQQLHNRLQWEETTRDLVAEAAASRTQPGAGPWARLRTPYRESSALLRTMLGHDFWVLDCAISPRGDLLASTSTYGLVVWDLATGVRRLRLDAAATCTFSPDGSTIISAINRYPDAGKVSAWDANTGALLRTSREIDRRRAERCAISPGGTLIVSAHNGGLSSGDLMVWEAETLQELSPDRDWGHRDLGPVHGCALTPDGSRLVVSRERVGLLSIELETRETLWSLDRGALFVGEVRGVAVSPDARLVAAGGTNGELAVLDLETGEQVTRLGEGGAEINTCAFSPDGTLLVSGRHDGSVDLWDLPSGERRAVLVGHADAVLCCAFSADGSLLVTGGRDQALKVWDMALAGEEDKSVPGHERAVSACVASRDGSFFLSGGDEGLLATWDAETGKRLRVLPEPAGPDEGPPLRQHYLVHNRVRYLGGIPFLGITDCALSADGRLAFCVSHTNHLATWDLAAGEQRLTWSAHKYPIRGCAISPDGKFLASAGVDSTLRIWHAESGRELMVLEGGRLTDCAVSDDGRLLVAAGRGGVDVWDPEKGAILRSKAMGNVLACAVSPGGSVVVGAAEGGAISIWDADTDGAVLTVRAHDGDANACAVTPDGLFVASAGSDHSVRLRRISDGADMLTLPVPARPEALALHPWLPVLAWGDAAGSVFVGQLVGLEYGPIVVTPVRRGRATSAQCPACQTPIALGAKYGGGTLRCPNGTCGLDLRISQRVLSDLRWSTWRTRRSSRKAQKAKDKERSEQPFLMDSVRDWASR